MDKSVSNFKFVFRYIYLLLFTIFVRNVLQTF